MKTLKCIGTGSSGNCYLLNIDGDKLLIEAGLPVKDIRVGIDYDISRLKGVVISHCHSDHSRAEDEFWKMGIPVFAPYHLNDEFASSGMGMFQIISFPVPHGETPNRAFVIRHGAWKLLYATDFEFIRYRFDRLQLNAMLIEANYCEDFIDRSSAKFDHVVSGHASLEVTKEIVRVNSNPRLSNVILCHLSDDNADPVLMRSEVQKVAPPFCAVRVARKGEVYRL